MNTPIFTSIFFTFVLFHIGSIYGKVFTRCELAAELRRQGIPQDQISKWVCIAEFESMRDTAAIGGPDSDGSYNWGIFQINDKYWCTPGSVGGICKVTCESISDDDITAAIACSIIIKNGQGFNAWTAWNSKCQWNIPNLSSCGI